MEAGVITLTEAVTLLLHRKLSAPLTVSVTVSPAHTGLTPVTDKEGKGVTSTRIAVVEVHPFCRALFTVYDVLTAGVTVTCCAFEIPDQV